MSEVVKDPKSNRNIEATLLAERIKQESIPIADRFLKPQTAINLEFNYTDFPAKVAIMDSAEGVKINLGTIANIAMEKLKEHNILYLGIINGKIEFGIYPASVRVLFLMTASSNILPDMNSRADILSVSHHIKSGNLVLISQGLTQIGRAHV